jgi:hypothetical protein
VFEEVENGEQYYEESGYAEYGEMYDEIPVIVVPLEDVLFLKDVGVVVCDEEEVGTRYPNG